MTIKTIRRCALALVLALSAQFACAAPPSNAQVDKLLDVMRARQTVETMLPQVEASQQQMVAQLTAGESLSNQQREQLQKIVIKSSERIREAMTWDKLQPMYRDIYRNTFTGEDMEAMIGFYGTPAGQKLLDKMPQLVQNTMKAMQQIVVPMIQQMQKDIKDELAENPATASDTQ